MRLLSKISAACAMLLGLTASADGQEARSMHDFGFIQATSPWITSRNAAGLTALPVERAAKAEGAFSKSDGGLIDNAGSENSFQAEISTESYMRISERTVFYGKLSYSYDRGRNMGGSILMDPSYNPVNFYESVDTTRGVKAKELYHLIGGISYRFKDDRWSLGAKIDYESGDQAKLKDPRFFNVWMDLGASAGFRFSDSEKISFGASVEYRRTLETVRGKLYGTSGKQYFTLIDYGGFYGKRELFDGSYSMVSPSDSRPMFNHFIGGSLQLEAGRKTKVFNELTYLRRSGYFGNKGTKSILFTEHGGNIIEYNGVLTTGNGSNLHRIGLDLRYEGIINNENVYRMSTQVGEYTEVEYLSQNEVLDRSDIYAGLSYTGYIGSDDFRARWEYGANAGFSSRQALTTIYPYYRSSSYSNIAAEIFGKRNILSRKNLFTIAAGADFMTGFGTPKDDGILANSSSEAPRSHDLYLYREFEFQTAPRAGAGVSFRYTRLFSDRTAGYVELNESFTSMLKKPEYLNNGLRNILSITIGCAF